MDQNIKKEWLEALRSGQYQQGTGRLKTAENEFCCLGVLCDILVKRDKGQWEDVNEEDATAPAFESDDGYAEGELPVGIRQELEIPIPIQATLIEMNDGIGPFETHSFAEIADYIEKYL